MAKTEAKYLRFTISMEGPRKKVDSELTNNTAAAFAAIASQDYLDPGLPLGTQRSLYRANVRSILLYGTPLVVNLMELAELDMRILQNYFKRLLFTARVPNPRLVERLCIRLRIPSFMMEVERNARIWSNILWKAAKVHHIVKIRNHARDAIESIAGINNEAPLREYRTFERFSPNSWSVREFPRWLGRTLWNNKEARRIDGVSELYPRDDILDTKDLTIEEKRSALRYMIYEFP